VNAVYSRSFTATDDSPAVPQPIPGDALGALSLQAMTWTNCGAIAQDEEQKSSKSRCQSHSRESAASKTLLAEPFHNWMEKVFSYEEATVIGNSP